MSGGDVELVEALIDAGKRAAEMSRSAGSVSVKYEIVLSTNGLWFRGRVKVGEVSKAAELHVAWREAYERPSLIADALDAVAAGMGAAK